MTAVSDRNVKLIIGGLPKHMLGWQDLAGFQLPWLGDEHTLQRDVCGRKRSPATTPSFRRGVSPNSKGKTYEPTPYTDDEILLLLDACLDTVAWQRLRAWIAFTVRSGLRISETLDLVAADLDPEKQTVLVRCGKGGKRRISAMDPWGWEQVGPWLELRKTLPHSHGHVFCVVEGPTRGGRWSASGVRQMLAKLKPKAGLEKRLAPHQLRHTLAVGLLADGIPLPHISRQLGHSNIATTDTYLRGISPQEIIESVTARPALGAR